MVVSAFKRCLFAGVWFAIAAAIPVAFFFVIFREYAVPIVGGSPILTGLFPVLIAGFCGTLLGAAILNPKEIKSGIRAAVQGLMIALFSYVLFIGLTAVISIIPSQDVVGMIGFFVVIFLYGLLFVGWLIALAGALAGLLLFLVRTKIFAENSNQTADSAT